MSHIACHMSRLSNVKKIVFEYVAKQVGGGLVEALDLKRFCCLYSLNVFGILLIKILCKLGQSCKTGIMHFLKGELEVLALDVFVEISMSYNTMNIRQP